MNYELLILDRAQEEINQAFEYYADISFSVMESFDEQLEQIYNTLELNPFFQFRYKGLKAIPIKSFPYIIFFDVDESKKLVYIYSVFNTYQDPSKYPSL